MRSRKKEEREFLESIDRLVAGEEARLGEDADEDLRSAVEFSRRLADLYPGPSPEFSERLKSRLLLKLTEQEIAARQKATTGRFWEALSRLVPRSPVWRTAAVTMVMLIAVVTVVWRAGMFTGVPAVEEQMLAREESTATVAGKVTEREAPSLQAAMEEEEAEVAQEAAPAAPIVRHVIEPNLTETVGGISITLEMVETNRVLEELETLSAAVVFTAFVTPPDYVPPAEDDIRTVRRDHSAPAEYTVGDTTIRLEYAQTTRLESGIRIVWGRDETDLPPVPSDAAEIIIRILSVDGHEGPWVFRIPLQD